MFVGSGAGSGGLLAEVLIALPLFVGLGVIDR